jgi:hypothetical protein
VPLVWRFVRIPGAEKLETQLAATLVVGVPLLPEGALEDVAKASGMAALGLVKEDALEAGSGGEKKLLEKALGTLKEGQPASVLSSGHLKELGPVKLPLLTRGDFLGGQASLVVGTRRALEGTPYQVIALAETKLLGTLAAYQRNAIFGLGALLAVSLVWTVLMGSGKRAAGEDSAPGGDTLGLGSAMAAMPSYQAPVAHSATEPPPATHPGLELTAATSLAGPTRLPTGEFPFGPPPSAHDAPTGMAPPASAPFGFPPPPAPQPQPFDAQPFDAQPHSPSSFPFDAEPLTQPQAVPPGGITAAPRAGAFHFEEIPTAAYSLQQAADPYAAAAALEESPETTRVAAIPRELLQAARPTTQELPMPPALAAPPPAPFVAPVPWGDPAPQPQAAVPQPGAAYQQFLGNSGDAFSEEEFHFQEVFREFVLTRERCSEPSVGLTYDKFVQKLRKNKEQLMQKYSCRTVKFQVYVKENKAALKATPVKD